MLGLQEKDFGRRSVCRNPNIASLLLRCNFIEKMGSGIERIHSALAEANCPNVKIHYNTMFTMEFPRPTYVKVKENSSTDMSSHDAPHDTPHDTPHVQKFLQALIGEMNRAEIMKVLNLKDRMHFSKKYMQPALQQGLVEMTIPDKPKSKLQKYRLTEKGILHVTK